MTGITADRVFTAYRQRPDRSTVNSVRVRAAAVLERIRVCAAESGDRQQPVNAIDDPIEQCPVMATQSQRHPTGMAGDSPGHGEQTVAHRRGTGIFHLLGQQLPKQHEHVEGERSQREPQRIGLMVGARQPPTGNILFEFADAILRIMSHST